MTLRNFFRKVAASHEPTRSRPCRSALRELELDAEAEPPLDGWKTSDDVAAGFVSAPGRS